METNPDYIYCEAKVQIIYLKEISLQPKEILRDVCFLFCPRTDVRINLARTKQPVKPVLQVKATAVCALLNLTGITVRMVSYRK